MDGEGENVPTLDEPLPGLEDPEQKVGLSTWEDPKQDKFKWVLDNFSKKKDFFDISSEVFTLAGYQWHIVAILKDITTEHLGMYLVSDEYKCLTLGRSWIVQSSMKVINQINPYLTVRKAATNCFSKRKPIWGMSKFITLKELHDPSRGYIVDDKLILEVNVIVNARTAHCDYDSKRETGFVGLKSQGRTLYLNSILQTLFHIPYFRKAVYQMLTTENEDSLSSVPLELQSFFYKLQYSEIRVSTKSLVQSLGWDLEDFVSINDAHDLNEVLFEELVKNMKGKEVEITMKQLFEGHQMMYIEYIHLDCKSAQKKCFLDLELEVKDCKDVYASFDKYVEVEHGFQDAQKSILFIDFPTVLRLHLRQFEYDLSHNTLVKLNDKYEFPLQLDLDRDNGRYLSPEAYRSVRNLFTLHSVLVHNGSTGRGHYYAYIRPTLTDQWYKFNDEVVLKVETKKDFEELYGNGETKVFTTAYMLVYIREDDKQRVMCNVDENDIIEDVRVRLKKKREEKEKKIKQKYQAEIYTLIKVATDEDLKDQIGKDIYCRFVDDTRLRSYQVQKQNYFIQFKDAISKEHNIAVQDFRFWLCNRFYHTYSPYRTITESEEHESVGYLQQNFGHDNELRLFLELNRNEDAAILPLPERTTDEILLFFKMYDPYKEKLRYVGRNYVRKLGILSEIIPKLNEMANFSAEQNLCLFKETLTNDDQICHRIDIYDTVERSQLHDADIICFQKCLTLEQIESLRFPAVENFLEYLRNKKIVHFRQLQSPNKDEFFLELSKEHTYNEVVEKIAVKLGMMDGASKIRLTCHNYYSQKPFLTSIDFIESGCLRDILPQCNQTLDILYFEVIDSPLPQKDCLKNLEVTIHNQKTEKVSVQSVLLPEGSTIGEDQHASLEEAEPT